MQPILEMAAARRIPVIGRGAGDRRGVQRAADREHGSRGVLQLLSEQESGGIKPFAEHLVKVTAVNDRTRFLEHNIKALKSHFGVKSIDVAIPTHMNDDHYSGFHYLKRVTARRSGVTKAWSMFFKGRTATGWAALSPNPSGSTAPCAMRRPSVGRSMISQ
jgi:hypothetical protein